MTCARVDVERLGLDHGRHGAEHRYQHLLAVAIVATHSLHTEAHKGHRVGHTPVDRHGTGSLGRDAWREVARSINLASARVEELDHSLARQCLDCGILHCGSKGDLVGLAQEARHARLHHHRFLCQHLAREVVGNKAGIIGDTLHNPSGIVLGSFKLDRDVALRIAHQQRAPQGRLYVGRAHLHLPET